MSSGLVRIGENGRSPSMSGTVENDGSPRKWAVVTQQPDRRWTGDGTRRKAMAIDTSTARRQVLDAADELFYERGVQAVGMDAIRTASGVSLKLLYRLFPSKDALIEAYLDRRDALWKSMLAEHVDAAIEPRDRILAVFDFLHDWFRQRDYRGCAFINS